MDTILQNLFTALLSLSVVLAAAPNIYTVDNQYTNVQTIPHIEEKDLPKVLLKISSCESSNRQFDEQGNVLRGKVNPRDIGRFQINLDYHAKNAKTMDVDLMTENGNRDYAYWLYKTQGTKPWRLSKKCWDI